MIYLVHPRFSLTEDALAEAFCTACDHELRRHTPTSVIDSQGQLHSVEPTSEDAVVFFNHRADISYHADMLRILKGPAKTFPVALSQQFRVPPNPVKHSQSFDLHNELRQRGLQESNAATVAAVLARAILASLQPTLSQFKMQLFLSHRRADGEYLASWFYKQLRQRAEAGFQDLSDVFVGEDAQSVIESRLAQSDAVIFLDTALAHESRWVAKELETALSLNLPIVWVSAGGDENGKYLKVQPSATPHLKIGTGTPAPQMVDRVLDQAFLLAREAGMRIFDTVRRLKDLSRANGLEIVEKSANKLLYGLRIPRNHFRYPEAPMKHVVQFFGRWPKSEDRVQFVQQLRLSGEIPDVGLLLAPIPPQKISNHVNEGDHALPAVVIDSGEEYVSSLERYVRRSVEQEMERLKERHKIEILQALHQNEIRSISRHAQLHDAVVQQVDRALENIAAQVVTPEGLRRAVETFRDTTVSEKHDAPNRSTRRGLIVSGAFPDECAPAYQQDLIDAVHAFARAVFDRGGTVIFGAHPVFIPLILDMAKRRRADFRQAVHLYFSTFFRAAVADYEDVATVFPISSVASDRNASLRAMRQSMIQDEEAIGLVAIGGNYPREGFSVGVDEEITCALARGLPVFLVGSVQGRSSELAAKLSAAGWKDKWNTLTTEQMEQLRISLDYCGLADMVLNSLGM